ncbi:hypothetical protein LUZ60_004467 [Juncus effusus]|nr:hypothetical protein LUZ60_004467 [Juncus effusus]
MAQSFHIDMLRPIRRVSIFLAALNLIIVFYGRAIEQDILLQFDLREKVAVRVVVTLAVVRLAAMLAIGRAQKITAIAVDSASQMEDKDEDGSIHDFARHEIRVRYRRWLYWTRFGMAITAFQFFAAAYLTFRIFTNLSRNNRPNSCLFGQDASGQKWKQCTIILFLTIDWLVVILQFFTGSDILRWRSFYSTHDSAWKAYYREVFDHGIREALCCLGRAKYLTVLEEDEVYSVARLLGDLFAYRASGTGHLELLAGLALLQKEREMPVSERELLEAPLDLIQEAIILHPFAEAAYTGPLLDFGRNPILFPCAWLYRQGILTPWTRNKRPKLEGDNWWRGHASAFLRFINSKPQALLRGRVCQTRREAAYFVVALHDRKTIVITVRGTETPEDLLTDGLCREINLNYDDLDGLINDESVISTFPHYGHGGIIEAARELFMQTDGLLSSLLGQGGELQGYKIRIVGHSLGGAVATLLGIRLYKRYPNLHVFAFGPLPCVDLVIAEACSHFVTTIVFNDEFSSRLSVNSILRLRSAAINSLSDSSSADSAMIRTLARKIFHNNYNFTRTELQNVEILANHHSVTPVNGQSQLLTESQSQLLTESQSQGFREIVVEPPEMFLAGKIIHVVREQRGLFISPIWKWWGFGNNGSEIVPFRAYVAKREYFREMFVTPFMFTDHLPWRCLYAMKRVFEARNFESLSSGSNSNEDCVEQHLV